MVLVCWLRILLNVVFEWCFMFLVCLVRWSNYVLVLFLMLFWMGFNVFSVRVLSVLEFGLMVFVMIWSWLIDVGIFGDNGLFMGVLIVFLS